MTHKYLEIMEEEYDEMTEIPNIIRINNITDEEAEALYKEHKGKFKKPIGKIVEGSHEVDSKLNKPCKTRKILSTGKLSTVSK